MRPVGLPPPGSGETPGRCAYPGCPGGAPPSARAVATLWQRARLPPACGYLSQGPRLHGDVKRHTVHHGAHDRGASTTRVHISPQQRAARPALNFSPRLWLASRVGDVPRSSNPIVVTLSSLTPCFVDGLQEGGALC